MISMIKTKELKHIAAASNGLTDELWNIISINTFYFLSQEALFNLCKGNNLPLSPFFSLKTTNKFITIRIWGTHKSKAYAHI